MRGFRTIVLTLACASLITGCGAQGGQGSAAHPDGWKAQGKVWIDPRNPREQFSAVSNSNSGGASLSDLASQVTTDALLTHKGARLLRSDRFPGCPGEAGLQSFAVTGPHETDVLRVAFTQWNGNAVIGSYQRPAAISDDPAAVMALTQAVCSAVAGTPTLPPAPVK